MSANIIGYSGGGDSFPLPTAENTHTSAPSSPKPERNSNGSSTMTSTMNGSSSPRSPLAHNGDVFTFQQGEGGLLVPPATNPNAAANAAANAIKSCKFKIDIAAVETSESGVQLRISFVHQQGKKSNRATSP